MRISVDPKDVGYHHLAIFCEVYLDGEKLEYVVTADEERGETINLARGPDGGLVVDVDQVAREVRRGRVEVRVSEDAPGWVKASLRG